MNDEKLTRFDDYWRTITRNEDYIRKWGHNPRPDAEDKWHQDLEDAYTQVRELLEGITQPRMFHGLPGGLNPFLAENCHHALMQLLNPPELWFGNIGILGSPGYLALKQGAEDEEKSSPQDPIQTETSPAKDDDMSPAERMVFDVIDMTPRQGKEVAKRITAKCDPADIRRYLSQLKKRGHISHILGKGYFRP